MALRVRLPAHNWTPRSYQLPLWTYLENGGRNAVAVWHRRSGKDEIALNWAAVAAHERRGNYWHLLPEYNQARKVVWDAVNPKTGRLRIDDAFPKELRASTNSVEMKISLKCGSIWQLVGSDNFNSLIGSPPVGVTYSEWSVANPRAHGFIRPILAENGGWALFIYTARGYNHGFTTYKAAQEEPGAFSQLLTASETGVFPADVLERERRAYLSEFGEFDGDALFRQEYFCDFSAANIGAVVGRYIEQLDKTGRITAVPYDPRGHPVVLSLDIGRSDMTAVWFWQPVPDGFKLIDFDQGSGMDAEQWGERLTKRCAERGYKVGKVWLPHDARVRTFQTRHTSAETLGQSFPVDIVRQSPKSDQINAARVILPNCWFDKENCAEGLQALREWQFEYLEEQKIFSKEPLHNWASHPGDGFAYGAQVMLAQKIPAPPPAPAKPVPPTTIDDYMKLAEKTERNYRRI